MAGVNIEAASLGSNNVNFVGRTEVCSEVVSYVEEGFRLVVISGAPGYGKSEAAIKIGHEIQESQGLDVLFFNLKEVTTLSDAAVLILDKLRIASTKPVAQLQQFLKSLSKKTVLILDNTENIQQKENARFLEFLKAIGESAINLCTLVTTTEVIRPPFQAKIIPLNPLNEEESMLLFKKYIFDMNTIQKTQAQELCKACMGIPLFLEMAASQVRKGVDDIILLIQELQYDPKILLEQNEVYFRCMTVFFSRLPESLKDVLAHLAVFPTSFTDEELERLLSDNAEYRRDIADIKSKISQLMDYSLLKFDEEKKTYQLHNVVQSFCKMDPVVLKSYNKAVYKFIDWHLKFLQEINVSFIRPDDTSALDGYSVKKRNILHALSLAIEFEHEPAIDVSTKVVNLLAKCLNIEEFNTIYRGFADIALAKNDMKRYSECLTSLGFKSLCYHGKENSTEAFNFLSEANDLIIKHQLPETEETAHCISKLGVCYARQGDIERGVEMIEKGIKIRKELHKCFGGRITDMLVFGGYCDLAMVYYIKGKFEDAVNIWENTCLAEYRRIMNNHPFTASLLQYIGDAYHKLHNYQKAQEYKLQALDMRKHLLTTNHQDTARSYSSLAETLEKLEKRQEAVEMLREALSIQSKVWASPEDISATKEEIWRIEGMRSDANEP